MVSRYVFFLMFWALSSFALSAQTCLPQLTLYNGLAVNLRPMDTNGDEIADIAGATVSVSGFIQKTYNPCSAGSLQFGIRIAGTGFGMPADTAIRFDCNLLGFQLIEVWARNASGGINFSETYILVQDNSNNCFPPPPVSTNCSNDMASPAIYAFNGLSGSLAPRVGDGFPELKIPISAFLHGIYDDCGQVFQYRIRKSGAEVGVPDTYDVTYDCNELGTQLVELWAGDANGNWDFSETYVIVQDNTGICGLPAPPPLVGGCSPDKTLPKLLACNGLVQTFNWSGTSPKMDVHDFIRTGGDKCGDFLNYRIRKAGLGSGPPETTSISFSCDEMGTQLVEIWLGDEAGNWTSAETYVIMQDNIGFCGSPFMAQAHVVIPEFKKEILRKMGVALPRETKRSFQTPTTLAVWPNPVTDGFTLHTALEQAGPVQVELYDNYGRLVRTLAEQVWTEAGVFQQYFQTAGLPGGLYRCVMYTQQERRVAAVHVLGL